jgi:hypothetical protein
MQAEEEGEAYAAAPAMEGTMGEMGRRRLQQVCPSGASIALCGCSQKLFAL